MPDLHKQVQSDLVRGSDLQLLAKSVVDGFLAGLHRSAHKGSSAQFKQHRPYLPGDDLRTLDWKIFGRTDRFFVREFEDETNLRAALLVDVSASMDYGTGDTHKLTYATRLAACLAHFLLRQQDAVGLGTFDARLREFLPGKTTPRHWSQLLDTLAGQTATSDAETDFPALFDSLLPRLAQHHRRGLVVLLTDAFGDPANLERGLLQLRTARHEVIVFQIVHRDELDLPFRGQVRFDALEGAAHRDIDADLLRKSYRKNLTAFEERLARACGRAKVELVRTVTDQPLSDGLRSFLMRRARAAGSKGRRR